MKFTTLSALVLTMTFGAAAHAYNGSIAFSDEVKAAHAANIQIVVDTAQTCLQSYYDQNMAYHEANGVSLFFGNRKYVKGRVSKFRTNPVTKKKVELLPIQLVLESKGYDAKLEGPMRALGCVDF